MSLFRFKDDPNEAAEPALNRHLEKSEKPFFWVSFGIIFAYKLELFKYFAGSSLKDAIEDVVLKLARGDIEPIKGYVLAHGSETILAIVTYLWWNQFSTAVKNEKKLLFDTYNKMNIRKSIGSIRNYQFLPYISFGTTIVFLLLAFLIDRLDFYCIVVFVLNIIDIWGNSTIRTTLTEDFWKKGFAPPQGDEHRDYIIRRAEVLEEYWIRTPQVERIGCMMIATCCVFVLWFSDQIIGYSVPKIVPYGTIVAAILLNKYIMIRWRRKRDGALVEIDIEEAKAFGKQLD
jgi:hypothetical protein